MSNPIKVFYKPPLFKPAGIQETLRQRGVVVDHSQYKITSGSNIVISPNFKYKNFTEAPNNFIWTVGTLEGNFIETRKETSFASTEVLTSLSLERISIKVKNVSDQEVVFIPISLTISNSSTGESASYTSYSIVYKGIPKTTAIQIRAVRNGRLIETEIYEASIEDKMKMYIKKVHPTYTNTTPPSVDDSDIKRTVQDSLPNTKDYMDYTQRQESLGQSPSTGGTTDALVTSADQFYKDVTDPASYDSKPTDVVEKTVHDSYANNYPGFNALNTPWGGTNNINFSMYNIPGRSPHYVATATANTPHGGPNAQPIAMPIYVPYPKSDPCTDTECECTDSTERKLLEVRDETVCTDPVAGDATKKTLQDYEDITTTTCEEVSSCE